jgi:hypothetical protein
MKKNAQEIRINEWIECKPATMPDQNKLVCILIEGDAYVAKRVLENRDATMCYECDLAEYIEDTDESVCPERWLINIINCEFDYTCVPISLPTHFSYI